MIISRSPHTYFVSNAFTKAMDIYNDANRIDDYIGAIRQFPNGDFAYEFLQHLTATGLSKRRVLKYAMLLRKILRELDITNAGFAEIQGWVAKLNSSNYKLSTKMDYKVVLKKLFQYRKYRRTDAPYPDEVAWIKVHVSERELEKESRINADKVLSPEDVEKVIKSCDNVRDAAMISVLYEGAFRPSELLRMYVGSVSFKQEYCVVTTTGKTGQKRLPLVLSYQLLLRWLEVHPFKSNINAPLWCSLDTNHRGKRLSYKHFNRILKKQFRRAGIATPVWPYLLRHSALTQMANKLTEPKLSLYAGWVMGTRMTRKYVHWSGRELDNTILQIHGLGKPEEGKQNESMRMKQCPRCSQNNPSTNTRCSSCGLVLDINTALQVEEELERRLASLEEKVSRLLDKST